MVSLELSEMRRHKTSSELPALLIASGFMLSLTGTSAAIVLRLVPVRTMKHRPEHKIIMGRDVALQHIWDQFIALDENKANLAYFLSIMLMSVRT